MNSNPSNGKGLLAELFPPDDPLELPVQTTKPVAGPVRSGPDHAPGTRAAGAAGPPSVKPPGRKSKPGPPPSPEPQRCASGCVVAVVNQKGGVGKTTTTINLGAALAREGARVLAVDFDPQSALTAGLGVDPNQVELSVYNLLLDRSVVLNDVVVPTCVGGLDLVPANIDLSAAEVVLVSEVAREQLLGRCLEPSRSSYDFILIDCPPSLGLLTVNALTAAQAVLVPLACEYFALRGIALLMDTVGKVQERLNPGLQVMGIVATMLEARTIHGREVLSRVEEAFGDKVFKTVIHKTIKFSEAPVAGVPILDYAPASSGAQQYRDLAQEVMRRAR